MDNETGKLGHCANCNIYGPMLLCSNCKGVLYCSRLCQKADWKKHKCICNTSTSLKKDSQTSKDINQEAIGICSFCLLVGAYRCSECKSAWYCTRVCQAADWKRHKPDCKRKCTEQKSTKIVSDKNVDAPNIDTLSINEPKSSDETKEIVVKNVNTDMFLASEYDKETSMQEKCGNAKRKHTSKLHSESSESSSNCKLDTANSFKNTKSGNCNRCNIMGCTQQCSRCRSIFYCSKPCQKEDWTVHKKSCKKEYTEEEKRIIEERLKRKKQQAIDLQKMEEKRFVTLFDSFSGGNQRFLKTLSPEKALLTASRPHGSLQKAIEFAKTWFPDFKVLTRFVNVPREPMNPFELIMMESLNMQKCLLVAFMYRYHEHVMRHGAYLKDDIDSESKVEFYLDHVGDNPAPFFSYSMVKPGNFICILKPLVHGFMDGTIGFKIEDPSNVYIIEKDILVQDNLL